jgi:hypothetical protein
MMLPRTLIIACGALAREIIALIKANSLAHLDLRCLPATLHNRPTLIADAVRRAIHEARGTYLKIYVAYADCGTGGALDRVLAEERVDRLAGPHCYATFAGQGTFQALADAEPGTFYLTDFLARQFETLVIGGLGLDRHPELRDLYFKSYTRLVHLAQTDDPALTGKAEAAARRLGLTFEQVRTGMGELETFIKLAATGASNGRADDPLLARYPGPGDRQGRAQDGEAPAAGALRGGDRPRRHASRAHRNGRLPGAMAEG